MKKILIIIVASLLPLAGFAQANITTKRLQIGDFTQKPTKIVLTGNMFYDSMLEDEILARWRISPYEFCSLEEFENIKTSDEFYFLLTVKGQFKKETEPGLQFLTLVKGGEQAEGGLSKMFEVISFPFAPAEDPSGREDVFFPAFIDIIQTYILDSMDKDIHAYIGLSNSSLNLSDTKDRTIIFSENDLCSTLTDEAKSAYFSESMIIATEDEADKYITENDSNVVVSYTVAPTNAANGSFCYKMLIDNQSHKLYYFKKHKISKKAGAGYQEEDLKRISSYRN